MLLSSTLTLVCKCFTSHQPVKNNFPDLPMFSQRFCLPVVVYDDLFDLSASGIRQQDFHANITFIGLAASLNLTLVYHLVLPEAYPDKRLLGECTDAGLLWEGE